MAKRKLLLPTLPRTSKKKAQERASAGYYYDLNVPYPSAAGSKSKAIVSTRNLLRRLSALEYNTVALTRTIYGRPTKSFKDEISIDDVGDTCGLRVLDRLDVVVEEVADVGYFKSITSDNAQILNRFDVVALVPKNAYSFSAACSSANASEVIVLDTSKGKLPYFLKQQDLQAAVARGASFEFWYGAGIADSTKRKYLVQAAISFLKASAGVRPTPNIVFASGQCGCANSALVLRSPNDLVNILRVTLGFDHFVAHSAMKSSARLVENNGIDRRCGKSNDNSSNTGLFSPTTERTMIGKEKLTKKPSITNRFADHNDLESISLPYSREVSTTAKVDNVVEEMEGDGFINL
eukprot:CAMPEP_0116026136 /NCGR_PEP_ID=MMETSP0321-20121206/13619_1 /TAXON_ID=163516 /ORGANISM="Leptocylindrus danicus var. danicus, Strain B650" /LENGTH=349 /DNA_ID=CAMNT_0003498773 /DNA_START=884 /DNA_END=1933 /DNA_ORIENTATION=-